MLYSQQNQYAKGTRMSYTQKTNKKIIQCDESKFVVYMTHNAHACFYTTCDKNLFRHITSSNIQYDSKMRFITKQGYHFMIEVPVAYKDRILSVINSNRQINAGTTTNPNKKTSQKRTHYNRPQKSRELDYCHPVPGRSAKNTAAKPAQKTSAPITMPLNLEHPTPTTIKEYNINDLTPQMVEKILGVKWDELCDTYFFYSYDNPLPKRYARELLSMRNEFERHPMFQGRNMAFATYGIAYYNGNKEYIEKPMLHDFSYGPTDPYCDMYGTFISYNPKTKQFEKYPRGWIKLKEDIDEYGYILSSSLSCDADKILSAYANQKQKRK